MPGVRTRPPPATAEVKIAPRMEAVLSGQNFQITAITPATQAVSRTETTEWRWEVSPKAPGEQRLHLVLNVELNGTSRTLRTFDETIEVTVTFSQQVSGFVGENWKWLWTASIVPIAAWLWKRRAGAPSPG